MNSSATRTQLFGNTCLLYVFLFYFCAFSVVAELNYDNYVYIAVTLKICRLLL